MLNIVIDIVAQKSGGQTKFINQLDQEYLTSSYEEESYQEHFTSALSRLLEMKSFNHAICIDKTYKAVFCKSKATFLRILSALHAGNSLPRNRQTLLALSNQQQTSQYLMQANCGI